MRKTKDQYFVAMLDEVCARSTCVRRAVGAILVDADGRLLSTGYNGTPKGFPHCAADGPSSTLWGKSTCPGATDPKSFSDRCYAVHAEQNALLFCHRLDLAHTLYVTVAPCFTCAKMILQTPIVRVIALAPYADGLGQFILQHAGKLFFYDHESGNVNLSADE